jgi:sec-independent protein translocase protein TatB
MFDIGWSELLVIGVVALIAIGPKELPGVLRMVGQWMGKLRRMASEFQGQFQEAMREAEMEGLKKQFDDISNTAASVTNFDPLGDIGKQVDAAIGDKPPSGTTENPPPSEPPVSVAAAEPEKLAQDNASAQPATGAPAEPEVAAVPQPKVGSGA